MIPDTTSPAPVVRAALAIVLVFTLLGVSVWIALPFIGAITWGAIIAISVYSGYLRLAAKLGGHRKLAAILIGIVIALILFTPLVLLFLAMGEHAKQFAETVSNVQDFTLPPLPAWLGDVPLIGGRITKLWHQAQTDMAGTIESIRPQLRSALLLVLSRMVATTVTMLEAALAIIAATIFLITGSRIKVFFVRLLAKVGMPDSATHVSIIERTVHAVTQGILGTAFIQAFLLWLGYSLADAPFPIFLAFLALILCSVQLGVLLIGLPVAAWMWSQGDTGTAIFIIGWTLFVNIVDNILKPILIGRDFPVPLWVGFIGVVGGLLAMGLIGLFIGPIALSVFYRLLLNWVYAEPLPRA